MRAWSGIVVCLLLAMGVGNASAQMQAQAQLPAQTQGGGPFGERAQQLRLEIDELRRDESEISQAGPMVMMIFGYVFAPFLLVGPVLLALDEVGCDGTSSTCVDLTTTGLVLTGLGVAGAAIGLTGILLAMDNSEQRRYLRGRIKDRQQELDSLTLGIGLRQQAGVVWLRGAF